MSHPEPADGPTAPPAGPPSPAAEGPVEVTRQDGVGTIRLARPEAMNALDVTTKVALRDAVLTMASDPAIRCLLLTGSGRAFCVGQDLREHARLLAEGDPSLFDTVAEHYNPIAFALATMPKPVVVAVNGVAAGAGASFAMAGDLRLFARSAGVNLAFTGVALCCDSGASWWLPRLLGPARARELLLRPRTLDAQECLRLGLASEVVDDADLADHALTVARELAAGPTAAYAAVREAVAHAAAHDLAEALAREAELMARTAATADHREAVTAFLARRRPEFTGR